MMLKFAFTQKSLSFESNKILQEIKLFGMVLGDYNVG